MENSLKEKAVKALQKTGKPALNRVAGKLKNENLKSHCDHTDFGNSGGHGQSTL
jgi:hypothetical protein